MAETEWTLPPARWPWQRSLQRRILFTYGAVLLVVLSLLMVVVWRVVYAATLDEAQHTLEVQAFLAANALEDPRSGYAAEFEAFYEWIADHGDDDETTLDSSPPGLDSFAQSSLRLQALTALFADDTGARVAILTPQGVVVTDSAYPSDSIPNQLSQPEVQSALQGVTSGVDTGKARIDAQSGRQTLFAAAPIQVGDRVLGVVRLSRPVAQVAEGIRPLLISLISAGLLALLAATLLGIGLSRRLARPLNRLEFAAMAMAGGDLQQQVPVETPDELGEVAIAFNVMAREVRQSFAQQRAFIANASHELRTPVTNIKLRSEALVGGAGDDGRVRDRYLAEIDREADRLGRLAGALLDLSRLDEATEGARLAPEPVDILPALHEVVEAMTPRAQRAGIALTAILPERLPPLRVRQDDIEAVVVNLLDNALKYTPPGGSVTLTARANPDRVTLHVDDTGPGIPPEDLPFIFDRFYRVDKARSRQASQQGEGIGSGAGLGLSIVRALVEENGGTILVRSDRGQGTSFVVELPAGIHRTRPQ